MLFKLKEKVAGHKVAGHVDEKGTVYKPGSIIESSLDLATLFRNKFEKIQDDIDIPVQKPDIPIPVPPGKGEEGFSPSPSEPKPGTEEEEEEEEGVESEYGKDVTSQYPTAKKIGMKVYEKSHWYQVIDTEDGEVMNEKKLREKEVNALLEQYEEEE